MVEQTPQDTSAPPEASVLLCIGSGTLKIGTCPHCVREEVGRPERAWDVPRGGKPDFQREALLSALAAQGLQVVVMAEYICP